MKGILECCVDSVESAIAAKNGGADRLELCQGLVIGGVTPGTALFQEIKNQMDRPSGDQNVFLFECLCDVPQKHLRKAGRFRKAHHFQ